MNHIITWDLHYKEKAPQPAIVRVEALDLVPLTGLEPVWHCCRGILSPLCLPISPQRHYDLIILSQTGRFVKYRNMISSFFS